MSSGTVAPGSVVGKPPGRRLAAMREGGLQALPFLAPALVLVFFFLIVPVIWTVLLSVNKTRGLNFGTEWIGLDNYERLLTRDSRFNHTYARRPVNAHPDFYAFWADGNTLGLSESNLYFTDRDGTHVWRLPTTMASDFAEPEVAW